MLKFLKTFVYFLTIICIFDCCSIQWGCGLRQEELIFSKVSAQKGVIVFVIDDLHLEKHQFARCLT